MFKSPSDTLELPMLGRGDEDLGSDCRVVSRLVGQSQPELGVDFGLISFCPFRSPGWDLVLEEALPLGRSAGQPRGPPG